jgi:hypothetical protein
MSICYHLGFVGEASGVELAFSRARITRALGKGSPFTPLIFQVINVNVRMQAIYIQVLIIKKIISLGLENTFRVGKWYHINYSFGAS